MAALSATASSTALARPGAAAPARASVAASATVHPDIFLFRRAMARPLQTAACRQQLHISCYGPNQIEKAYGLPQLYSQGVTGAGETIVIVDSFGSPTIRQDLRAFDQGFGLPAPPSFKIIQPAGPVPPFRPIGVRISWAAETSLDVEYAHAVAPGASILLVETPVAETEGTHGFPQIVTAEEFVIKHHLGAVISQSFGATERSFPSPQSIIGLRAAARDAKAAGITMLASTGDDGAANVKRDGSTFFLTPQIAWPASDPLVTAVGGTRLNLTEAGNRLRPDTVWNDTYNQNVQEVFTGTPGPSPFSTGGGHSAVFSRPSYQDGVAGAVGQRRGVPDISMSAACNGAVFVHLQFAPLAPGFYLVCGTSEASPEFAGIVALSAQVAGHLLGAINPALYRMAAAGEPGIVDVTQGNNTVSFFQDGAKHTVHGFPAGPGYDLSTGVGTVWAPDFVPELARAAG